MQAPGGDLGRCPLQIRGGWGHEADCLELPHSCFISVYLPCFTEPPRRTALFCHSPDVAMLYFSEWALPSPRAVCNFPPETSTTGRLQEKPSQRCWGHSPLTPSSGLCLSPVRMFHVKYPRSKTGGTSGEGAIQRSDVLYFLTAF